MNNVFVFPFDEETDRPNIVYLKGSKKSILVDAGGGPKMYEFIESEIHKLNLPNPDYVVLTHFHWDHAFGNGYFECPCICSKYTNEMIQKHLDLKATKVDELIDSGLHPEFCREHLKLEYGETLEKLKLKKCELEVSKTTLDLGERLIEIMEVPSSHTEGSLIVYDKTNNLLIVGDANCGYIVGTEFYNDTPKQAKFLSIIREIKPKHIIVGHSDIYTYDDFFLEYDVEK